jgi:uncharacterized membrane protein YdjX (TVP38/TMEM64 family)
MTFAMCSSWHPSVRGLLAGGLAGLMVFGIVAARVSPEGATGAAAGLLRVLHSLGFTGAVIFAGLQTFVAVSGILPASLPGVAAGAIYGLVPGLPPSRDQCYGGCRPCVFSQQIPVPPYG